MKLKSYLRKISIFLIFLHFSNVAYGQYCNHLSTSYKNQLNRSFKQSPIDFIQTFLKASSSQETLSDSQNQNALVSASFDIKNLYVSNAKNFKSKIITNTFFDWVRTQYFGNLNKNYLQKKDYLLSKNFDLLTDLERTQLKNFKPLITSFEKRNCTKKEETLLGCKKSIFKMTVQVMPEISCKKRNLRKAFETDFLLTYSSRYGFKVLDLKLSGKRIVMNSMEHMTALQQKGFNKNAIASRLSLLSKNGKTFRLPKRQINTKKFLAKFQRNKIQNTDRVPASL